MQSSIIKRIGRLLRLINIWFNASVIGRFFNRVSKTLATAFSTSLLGRFFTPKEHHFFKESLFYKLLSLPITLCKLTAKKCGKFAKTLDESSSVIWFFNYWHSISIRTYGFILLFFSVSYSIMRCLLSFPSLYEWIGLSGLALVSLLMIAINRSVKSLFKGSRILTAIGSLFCEIKKDVDSKLFLKDPEFFFSKQLTTSSLGVLLGVAAACIPFKIFLLIIGGLFFVGFTLRYPVFGVYCVILASPIMPTMALLGACLVCVLSFFLQIATGKKANLRPVPLGGFIAFFMLTMCLATLLSFTFAKSLQILLIYIVFSLFYFVAYQTLDTKKKWKGAIISLVLVAAFVALVGIYQNFAGVSGAASWVDQEMFSQIKTRVYSTFDNPNVLGEFLVMMVPLALAVLWKSRTDGQKFIYTAIFLALGACMIFTWSRGAWLGVLLATALFLLIADKRWSLLAVVGVLLLPVILSSNSAIVSRIVSVGNTQDTSTAYRVSIWQASITMIRDFWLSGIGLGSEAFSMIYPRYALAGANFALHSHNLFLQIMVEAGIAGIIAFVLMIIAFVRRSFSRFVYQKRNTYAGAIVLALTAGVLGFLFQGLTDNVWYNYKMVLIFWIVLALAGSPSAPDFDGGDCK
ncbi:MAG: O-antigen ligase family protein [Clostridia bacterium]|nr:O-antigen ligase family protein [Clostridia bacterium]